MKKRKASFFQRRIVKYGGAGAEFTLASRRSIWKQRLRRIQSVRIKFDPSALDRAAREEWREFVLEQIFADLNAIAQIQRTQVAEGEKSVNPLKKRCIKITPEK